MALIRLITLVGLTTALMRGFTEFGEDEVLILVLLKAVLELAVVWSYETIKKLTGLPIFGKTKKQG